jgi:DNA-binding PadR family transcriptional regulator
MATTLTPAELQILLALTHEPRHGYGIKLNVESRTNGTMKLGSGTLYEAIQRMEKHGWLEVAKAPGNDPAESRRKYYRLTSTGRTRLQQDLESLQDIVADAIAMDILPETKPV